jgi:hypothetical protein
MIDGACAQKASAGDDHRSPTPQMSILQRAIISWPELFSN